MKYRRRSWISSACTVVRLIGKTLAAAGAIACSTAFANRSTAKLPILRELVFDTTYDVQGSIDLVVRSYSGFSYGKARVPQNDRRATVTVDVVAATSDGGLAVDVREDSDFGQGVPTMRVAVTRRDLTATDDAHLTEEERLVLHMLARTLIEPMTVEAGDAWIERVRENGVRLDIRYDVTSIDPTTQTLDVTMAGAVAEDRGGGIAIATTGSMRYDLRRLVPLQCSMHTTASAERSYGTARAVSDVTIKLRADSFADR